MIRPSAVLGQRGYVAGDAWHGGGKAEFKPKIEFALLLGAWTIGFAALVSSWF